MCTKTNSRYRPSTMRCAAAFQQSRITLETRLWSNTDHQSKVSRGTWTPRCARALGWTSCRVRRMLRSWHPRGGKTRCSLWQRKSLLLLATCSRSPPTRHIFLIPLLTVPSCTRALVSTTRRRLCSTARVCPMVRRTPSFFVQIGTKQQLEHGPSTTSVPQAPRSSRSTLPCITVISSPCYGTAYWPQLRERPSHQSSQSLS
mmetsp:Transcript_23598/g.62184  ORF Transcript_23598/g.62184 Transcript_23598/m.62184 type:complete len:202 (+) Transcript_23598:1587-2192(+)